MCSTKGDSQISRRSFLALLAGLSLTTAARRTRAAETEGTVVDKGATGGGGGKERSGRKTVGESSPLAQPSKNGENRALVGRQTSSGITFIDYESGEGATPQWGDYVNIDYVLYTVNDTRDGLVQHASSLSYKDGMLFHHGNGELIIGLEEMLHSMRAGARRRCIVPPGRAYTHSGFMPIPASTRARRKFINAIEQGDGTVVLDVRLNWFEKDPDDQGYYSDLTPTEDELRELFQQRKGQAF